jgi:uncharacterized LabA/DUF88 family protein
VYGNLPKQARPVWGAAFQAEGLRSPTFVHRVGNNAADIALIIDAVELLHTEQPDGVCLLSRDGHFAQVVRHLRNAGLAVHVFGEWPVAQTLQRAATAFHLISPTKRGAGGAAAQGA